MTTTTTTANSRSNTVTTMNKGILKKPAKKPPSVTSTGSTSSWLTRIQSKLYYSSTDGSDPYAVPALPRQELKRVTFSVRKLTTEYILYNNVDDKDDMLTDTSQQSSPSQTTFIDDQQQGDDNDNDQFDTNYQSTSISSCRELPKYYERACRLREEQPLESFMDLLRSSCFSRLTTINLANQMIDSRQAGPIADILMLNCGLCSLDLSNCGMNDETVRILLHSLLITDRLPELKLAGNAFKADGFKYISIYISQSRAIKSIDLSRSVPDKRALRYLSHAVHIAPSLQKLILDHCSLKAPLIEILAGGVRQSISLNHLSLRHNRISQNAAPWIAAMLINDEPIEMYWQTGEYPRRGIQQLDLTGNYLQQAVASIAQALYNNRSLTHLILTDCQIYPNECARLAEALLSNHHLQVLDLSDNPLANKSDEGIQSIKTALSRNHFLRELNLAGTDLDSSAAIALAECLPENSTLSRLDLSRNPHITMAGVLALSISIKMNHTLTFLDINIPPNEVDMAELQNDIVAVCTRNMQRSYEDSLYYSPQKLQEVDDDEGEQVVSEEDALNGTSSSSTLSSSSSSSSSPRSHNDDDVDDASYHNSVTNSTTTTTTTTTIQDKRSSNVSISSAYSFDEIPM
ncbi:hypothetical protein BDB00DRAFT_847025 [Zychaea mexicana]|uniref:uncharacterized protein n=1 Tax=Zychaea mexicana TaxID=64656 RepID=UPI0022FE3BC1|nr:uncharacterized protein BDB00DRAFT_847025 [Zychaea mexicana]KAI9488697.1 hypothetical protein BDB00DRAFT_847025 [Zychaea mexicana]